MKTNERLRQILICDDDPTFHLAVKYSLKGKFEVKSAYNGDEALTVLKNHLIDAIVLDVSMRTQDEGLRYIPRFREVDPEISIVMASGLTDFQTVKEAMRLGASDYVPKDFDPNDLIHTLDRVLERRQLLQRQEQQNYEAAANQKKHVMVGESQKMAALRKTIEKMRASPANVVITGETGTGKEVVARQLRGARPDGSLAPFIAVDSSTIQSSMAESMLFGHEKGAFTGADRAAKGIFEEADGGIVYFDEIANMPLDIQAKLLRVLQEKEVTRMGSAKSIQLEFRVVCATNKNLPELVRQGLFKEDLLQRLNVLPIDLAPLRERKEDVPALLAHFGKLNPIGGRAMVFTTEAIDLLMGYSWPGNVRELQNLVAYLAAMTEQPEIDVADLPPRLRDATAAPPSADAGEKGLYERVSEFERQLLAEAYEQSAGNISKLALRLGMDRSHLYTKLKLHGIHPARAK